MPNITRLPLSYRQFTDTELEIAFWHLSTASRAVDDLILNHKRVLPFAGGMRFPGQLTPMVERWEKDLIELDQHMQKVIKEMTLRKMKLPDYAAEKQSPADEWQAQFERYEKHLGGSQ